MEGTGLVAGAEEEATALAAPATVLELVRSAVLSPPEAIAGGIVQGFEPVPPMMLTGEKPVKCSCSSLFVSSECRGMNSVAFGMEVGGRGRRW